MPNYPAEERQPLLSFIYLVSLALAGAIIFTLIAYITGVLIYGTQVVFESQRILTGTGNEGIGFLKLIQIASTLGTFIVPAFIFARMESRAPLAYLKLNTSVRPIFVGLVIVLMFVSGPALEWTVSLNKQMHLPDFMAGLENWMRRQEDQLQQLTIQLLKTGTLTGLLINILMIAVLPAIGEELIFRGCLQRIITRKTQSHHWGIWIAAMVFSAIHIQFYGFLPRMLLGGLFGYLLVWTNSIWIPIIGHFINNAATVVFAFIYQQKGQSLEKLINEPSYGHSSFLFLFSCIFTALILWYMYKKSTEFNRSDAERLG